MRTAAGTHADANCHGYANANANAYTYTYSIFDSDCDTNVYTCTKAFARTEASSHTGASPITEGD